MKNSVVPKLLRTMVFIFLILSPGVVFGTRNTLKPSWRPGPVRARMAMVALGRVRPGTPYLVAVEHPMFTVEYRSGARGCRIGACLRLTD